MILSNRALALGLFTALTFAGCASTPKSDYPATANAPEEIQKLDAEMTSASQQGTDVLSPDHFKKAREKLADARQAQEKGKDQAKVLGELSAARAELNAANTVGERGRALIPDILTARNNAIRAGAPSLYSKEFKKADGDLNDLATTLEKGKELSANDRGELQRKYMDVELKAIKKTRLGDVEAKLERARDMKAKKYAPKTLEETEVKYKSSLAVIDANRTNEAAIAPSVADTQTQANKLMEVTQVVADSKGKTSEAAAVAIVDQRHQIAQQAENLKAKDAALQSSEADNARQAAANARQSAEQAAVLAGVNAEKDSLSAESRFNKALAEAQKMFKPEEAEAYRQGDQLVLRLKKINFASGKADLPSSSLSTLGKVKEVVGILGAEKVMVEGHTDSVGSKTVNAKVSQERADAVKEYLVSDSTMKTDAVEAKGYGFDKPIAPNKTKAGRAQNRRVDIIITPNQG